ncbi:ABC transporter permease [Clostridia bacterium]|nr:ABC transporter permease [Clostridia bacterium]
MNFVQSLRLALSSIVENKMRSFLTMLGMLIGVASVIALVSLMTAMSDYILDLYRQQGANNVTATVRPTAPNIVDFEYMKKVYDDHSDVFYQMGLRVPVSNAIVKKDNQTSVSTYVVGVTENHNSIDNWHIKEGGRYLEYSDISNRSNVCIIGSYIEKTLFENQNPIGKTIKINNEVYTVVGVLRQKVDSVEYGADDNIQIPYTNAMKLNKSKFIPIFLFAFHNNRVSEEAKNIVTDALYAFLKDEDHFIVRTMKEILDMAEDQLGMLSNVLLGIASIALFVAGIGIMNIMLVSVTERTREIGIRKSLGAKRADIMWQFILEAGLISSLGGLVGIILGAVLTIVIGRIVQLHAFPTLTSIIISFGISVGTGILFGFLPANQASKMNPIDALKSD